jgi:hypothetical protein
MSTKCFIIRNILILGEPYIAEVGARIVLQGRKESIAPTTLAVQMGEVPQDGVILTPPRTEHGQTREVRQKIVPEAP